MSFSNVAEAVLALLPNFMNLVDAWMTDGKDPREEMKKLMDSVDVAADAAEELKFGP